MKRSSFAFILSMLMVIGLFLTVAPVMAATRGVSMLPTMTEYPIPTASAGSYRITSGPDGALWFTEFDKNKIGRMTTAGTVTEFAIPTAASNPSVIIPGPDGALWFTERATDKIGRITTGGTITEFPLATGGLLYGLTFGPDGAIWFTDQTQSRIGRLAADGTVAEYPTLTPNCWPVCIINGPDGAMWYTNNSQAVIGRITTSGVVSEFPVPGGITNSITLGPDGAMWFTEFASQKIGRITTAGAITEFAVPAAGMLLGIAAGPDGSMWFSCTNTNQIGRITPAGVVTLNAITTINSAPCGIATGSDGAIWFTETDTHANQIGTFSMEHPVWFLAEGSTNWGYDCYLTIENPNDVPVSCDVTYMPTGAPNFNRTVDMAPMSQLTVNPRADIGSIDFSTRVLCTTGRSIAVDRTMIWTGPGALAAEAHASVGVTSPATTWFLAEGSTAWGFECWLLIQNPTSTDASCTVTYMIEGEGPRTVVHPVPANQRATFNVANDIGAKDASIRVVSNVPVIPERAMYRNNRREGHDSIGTTAATQDYYLAEGAVGYSSGFTTYILVQNPNDSPTDVNIIYQTATGAVTGPSKTMPPNSRWTVTVNNQLPPNTDVSTHVFGSQAIIAERAMYWRGGPDSSEACHDSIGLSTAHTSFYLPDGQTSNGRETWTLVQNPNAADVVVRIQYLTPGGVGADFNATIPANSRRTFNMADRGIAGRASVLVTSTDPTKKIMVERSMYSNARGAGTDTIGGFSD